MKIIFAGTPVFAATALEALIAAHHDIALVLTQPDRPAGRGMKTVASAVKQSALQHGLAVLQPSSLKDSDIQTQILAVHADIMIVAAYGLILPEAVLTLPRLGCLNIHASLLPRWRGAAPIQRAILAGDRQTGITVMQMDAGLDTGAMLLKRPIAIALDDTTLTLHDKLCTLGAQAIVEALTQLQQNKLTAQPQDESLACYAAKIHKSEALIDWQRPAETIARAIRAYNPSPGAFTLFHGQTLKVWQAGVVEQQVAQPGTVTTASPAGIVVACGHNAIQLEVIQKSGGKRLTTAEFLAGNTIQPGDCFDTDIPASHG